MGMYTIIVDGDSSIQIQTGVDSCESFQVGDDAPIPMDDGVYDGLSSKPGQDWKDHQDVWVIVHDRNIQTVLYNRTEGDSVVEAVTEYLTLRGEAADPIPDPGPSRCEGCFYSWDEEGQCLMPPPLVVAPTENPCEGCGQHSKRSHRNGVPKYMLLCEHCVDLRLKLTNQGPYYKKDT